MDMDVETLRMAHRISIRYAANDESSLLDAVRDEGTLEYIADRAETFGDRVDKGAWLLWSISTMHPFVEGNKRTAVLACQYALGNRLFDIEGKVESLNRDVRSIAEGYMELKDVKRFIFEKTCIIVVEKKGEEESFIWYGSRLEPLLRKLSGCDVLTAGVL